MRDAENRSFSEVNSEIETLSVEKARLLSILPRELVEAVGLIADLKGRQIEVVSLLAEGRDNHFIAVRMGISESTVKQYITSIMLRIRVKSRLQVGLVGFAMKAASVLELADSLTKSDVFVENGPGNKGL